MENVGWEALKKENSPRRKESSVPQYKINRSQTSSKLLSSFKPDFLQILEKLLCIIPKSPLGSRAARHKPVCIGTSYQITALPGHSNLPWRSTWCWPLGWAHHGADPVTPVPKALASTQRRWTWNKASPCSSAGHASKMNNQLQKTFCFSEDKHGVQLHTATSISLSSFPQFELYLLIISDTSMPYLQLVKNIVIFWNTVLLLQWMCQHCCQMLQRPCFKSSLLPSCTLLLGRSSHSGTSYVTPSKRKPWLCFQAHLDVYLSLKRPAVEVDTWCCKIHLSSAPEMVLQIQPWVDSTGRELYNSALVLSDLKPVWSQAESLERKQGRDTEGFRSTLKFNQLSRSPSTTPNSLSP